MSLMIAMLPVAVALGTLGILAWNGRKAGLATLVVAVALAAVCGPSRLNWDQLALGLAHGTPTIFMVVFVLFAGLVLYHLQRQAGGLDAIAQGIIRLSPRRDIQILVLVLGVAPAVESVSGFGVGTVVIIPVLATMGLRPLRAAMLGLLSQVAIPWGALAVGTTYAAELTGLEPGTTGVRTALLTIPLPTMYGLVAMYVGGGWSMVGRGWAGAAAAGACMSFGLWMFSRTTGVELAGFLASLLVVLVLAGSVWLVCKADEITPSSSARLTTLGWERACLPYLVLVGLLLLTRLTPTVQDWLGAIGTVDVRVLGLRYPVLTTPGFWMLMSALAAVPILGLGLRSLGTALVRAWQQILPGAVPIICFLETAQVMRLAGMTAELGAALATLGGGFCLASPWLGALGGWLTGSNTGSNALFAPLQVEAATQTGYSPEWLVAGQNAAGSHAAMVSPARTVLAATSAGLGQAESMLMRVLGPVVLLAVAVIMLILWCVT